MTLIACIVVGTVTLGLGGFLTEIGPWYFQLDVPAWKPPNWVFGPIWTVIGICSVTAADLGLRAVKTESAHRLLEGLFGVNAVLNVLWTLLFFKLHRPDWALAEVVPLWLSVLALMIVLWRIDVFSSLLLLPYLVWVGIAATLNRSVVRRNAPFGAAHRPSTLRIDRS